MLRELFARKLSKSNISASPSSCSLSSTNSGKEEQKRSSRRLRFSNKVEYVQVPARHSLTKSQRRQIWFQRSDSKSIRNGVDHIAKSFSDADSGSKLELYSRIHLDVYRACEEGRPPTESPESLMLGKWTQGGDTVRGLEKNIIAELFRQKSHRVKAYIHTVIRLHNETRTTLPSEERTEYLRYKARLISRPDSLYARAVALSDENDALT